MDAPLRVAIVGGASIWSTSRERRSVPTLPAHHRTAIAVLTTEPRSAFIFVKPNQSVE